MTLRLFQSLFTFFLISFGLIVLAFGIYLEYPNFNQKPQLQSTVYANAQPFDLPTEVSIPSAKINAPIIEGAIENGEWKLSNDAVLTLSIADQTKTKQATLIYGHDFVKLFANLRYVKIGDNIYLNDKNGKAVLFKVISKEDIDPTQVDKLEPDQNNELILYSCDGFMDKQRVLIKAKLI